MSLVVQTQNSSTTAAADDPLLSCTVTTTPSPLKASPENPQVPEEIGELIFSVARQSSTPADVEWIKVKVPAGAMAPDLATDLNKISPRISLTGWTARLDATAKEFVFEPTGSHAPIGPDTGFTIQLSDIPMSRKVGTAPITITERSRTGNSAFQNRPTIFNIGKFPADFYLRNFLCTPSIVPNPGDVKLTWERSANATYELLYGDVNLDVTNRTSLDIEGIKSDTTFYLRATTGDPTNPVVRILSAQVSVTKPDLDIGNLTVNGSTRILHRYPPVAMRDSSDWRATTDGIVTVAFKSIGPNARNIDLRIRAEGSSYHDLIAVFSADAGAEDEQKSLSVPLQRGECLHYLQRSYSDIDATVHWCSFGDGELEFLGIVPW
ncbi:hypothetical protein P3T36_003038 [Kitasatospora sp. MAP12-15]|uniref:hypothetical protein n=1 Tax=unclassified Kitasatospora TaxID=2633591 RepID=UPI0024759BDC|nr:hypothetical protein [Kitasatospora sp. MAP12-44]MDH6110669.1 hypothetical protein [Kitasatospora sp. MAP12-44]